MSKQFLKSFLTIWVGLCFIMTNLFSGYVEIDSACNWEEDIQFLQDSTNHRQRGEKPSQSDYTFRLNHLSDQWRLSFDSIKMPDKDEPMGLLGFYYLAKINPWFYSGIGSYSAIMGNQGGLFTLGIEGGIHHRLLPELWVNAGVFVGGGGGKVGTGDGLMVRSHIGISYDFDRFKVGSNYSYVSFPDSRIRGSQVSLSIDIPTQFYYTNPNCIGKHINNLNQVKHISGLGNIVFNRHYMALVGQSYFQKSRTKNTTGKVQDDTIWLMGFELGRFITQKSFILLKTSGAFKGNPHGYMDVFAGVGYNYPLIARRFSLSGKIRVGAGGGGHVETGGGLLFETNIGLLLNVTPNIAAQIDGGYIDSPDGNLNAISLTSKLMYSIETANISHTHKMESVTPSILGLFE